MQKQNEKRFWLPHDRVLGPVKKNESADKTIENKMKKGFISSVLAYEYAAEFRPEVLGFEMI